MNQNAILTLGPKLASEYLALDALIAQGAPEFSIMQARKRCRILAADLKAAHEEKQPVTPWTPWNPRASIIAHSPGCAE